MKEKCFCHFNGFAVKDATARKEIIDIKKLLNDIELCLDNIIQIQNSFIGGN